MRARIEATGRADLVQPDNPFESTPGLFFSAETELLP